MGTRETAPDAPTDHGRHNHLMPTVPGYTHTPGHHCGSTALRNLLAFHGVEISEELAFGLGAGACFYYVTIEDAPPPAGSTAAPRGSRRTSAS